MSASITVVRFFLSSSSPVSRWTTALRRAVPFIAILGVASSVLEGVAIALFIPLIEEVLGATAETGRLAAAARQITASLPVSDNTTRASVIAVIILTMIVAKNAIVLMNEALVLRSTGQFNQYLGTSMFSKVVQAPLAWSSAHTYGRLMNILNVERWRVFDAARELVAVITSVLHVFVFAVALFLISWRLAIGVLIGAMLIRWISRLVGSELRSLSAINVGINIALVDLLGETLTALRTIHLFGLHNVEAKRFNRATEELQDSVTRITYHSRLISTLAEVSHTCLLLGTVFVAWRTGIDFPSTAAFVILLYRMQPYFRQCEEGTARLNASTGSLQEIQWLVTKTPESGVAPQKTMPKRLRSEIRFESVDFCFTADSSLVLSDVNFSIPMGRTTALIGASGSGKSTLVNLLCGLYEPTGGHISVDGQALRALDQLSWRQILAVTGQDTDLFTGTIRKNIMRGDLAATTEQIEDAARLAHADEFIASLPGGLDFKLTSRGGNLSGGQRQRILLARALIRKPQILILDEATSSIDLGSERVIRDTLKQLHGRLTIVIIAHRSSTIDTADHVICLANGRVVEAGVPAELQANGGWFCNWLKSQ